jgi:hypothetical protein
MERPAAIHRLGGLGDLAGCERLVPEILFSVLEPSRLDA